MSDPANSSAYLDTSACGSVNTIGEYNEETRNRNNPMDTESNDQLRVRITELEQQLADAARKSINKERDETGLLDSLAYAESIVDTVREPLVVLDGTLRVRTASHAFFQTFAVSPNEAIGQFLYDLGNGQWNIPALRTMLEAVMPKEKHVRDFEVMHDFRCSGTGSCC